MKRLEHNMSSKRENNTDRTPRDPKAAAYWDTPLHAFLLVKLAHVDGLIVGGRIDTKALALKAGVSRYTIYRWFQAPAISRKAAKTLIQLSKPEKDAEPLISVDEIAPFAGL